MSIKKIYFYIFSLITVLIILITGFYFYEAHYKSEIVLETSNCIKPCNLEPKVVSEQIITRLNAWSSVEPKTDNTVVQIFSEIAEYNWLQPYSTPNQNMSSGSGFFIDASGLIVTNAHVVNQAKYIYIQIPFFGKRQFDVDLIGISFERDLALLQLTEESINEIKKDMPEIKYLTLGDSTTIKRGDEVMAMGYPLGQESIKSTTGVVSGLESLGRPMIQIDAAINPGNSGGPSINPDGQVIGINTAGILSAQNIGYIIPVNELKVVLEDLKKAPNKLLRRPFLGLNYQISSSQYLAQYLKNPIPGGCYVVNVFPGSILEKAGLEPGDMIYEIDGLKVDSDGELLCPGTTDRISLTDYASFWVLGQEIKMTIYRKGVRKELTFKFEYSKLPAVRVMYPDFEKIEYEVIAGMVVMELTRNHIQLLIKHIPTLIKYENPKNQVDPVLVVSHVLPGSFAQRSRVIVPGTLLKQINGRTVKTLEQFRNSLQKSLETKFMTIKTEDEIFVAFPFKQILEQEKRLSHIYHYPISENMRELKEKFFKKI